VTGGDWQHQMRVPLRWSDFDRHGHVNFAAYHVFLAEARVALMDQLVGEGAVDFVAARTELDYRQTIPTSEDHVQIDSRVAKVGTKSITYEQQLTMADGTVAAEGRTVVVAWDSASRAARAIDDRERAALTQ
jgi:acyl-CoA thioester hydrolase